MSRLGRSKSLAEWNYGVKEAKRIVGEEDERITCSASTHLHSAFASFASQ